MEHKITPRQLEALVSCYFGQLAGSWAKDVFGEGHEKAGQPVWRYYRGGGNAVYRMVEELRHRGYISNPIRGDQFGDKSHSDLTAKGYAALQERLDKLPAIRSYDGAVIYQFEIDRDDLIERAKQRTLFEEETARKRAAAKEEQNRRFREHQERDRAKLVARFRQLFKDHSMLTTAHWGDQEVLEFAEQAGDAIHSH
jgi:hypothetical protein